MSYYLKLEHTTDELPIDLDFVKKHFDIPVSQTDEYISKLLKMAISQAESYTERSILFKRWCYINKQTKVFLPKPPIVEIVSVEVLGKNGNFVKTTKYSRSMHSEYATITLDKKYPENTKVKITYNAGFNKENLPTSIEQFIMQQFGLLYYGSSSEQKQNYNYLLDPYKNMRSKL